MKKYLLTLLLICTPTLSFSNGSGTVSNLLVGRLGTQAFIKLAGTVDPAGCRTRTDWHYYLDLSTPGAKEIFATLLLAKATSQSVLIVSSSACDTAGQGLEVLSYVIM